MGLSPTYNLGSNLQIPRAIPSGLPKELVDTFNEIYTGMNNLAVALITECGAGPRDINQWSTLAGITSTIQADNGSRFYVIAGEALNYGDIINIYSVGGSPNARKANATNNTKPADGFCSSPSGIAIGVAGEVILAHGVLPASGLTTGQRYYLSTASGFISSVPATAAGNIEQYLGVALNANALYFNSGYWIQH